MSSLTSLDTGASCTSMRRRPSRVSPDLRRFTVCISFVYLAIQ